jgi:hypothetical protein
MTSVLGSVASDDFMHKILRDEIYRVCSAVNDKSGYSGCAYGSQKPHLDLLLVCKGCKRDTTELERAIKARDDAELHLKNVTTLETSYLRNAIETHKIRPREEDLT